MPYIDAHSHIWTPDVAHYPLASGYKVEDMQPKSFTAQELLELCRPSGVTRVNLIQMSFYGYDNSYMLDMIKLYPDVFVGTAVIDHTSTELAQQIRELKAKGIRAFRIRPEYQGGKSEPSTLKSPTLPPSQWLEPEGYRAMFAEAAKQRMALSCLINPNGFAEVQRMATQFPRTAIIIDHLGRIGANGTIADEDVEALCALAVFPRIFVKVGAFYALGKKTPPYLDLGPLIKRVVQAFGPDRCMWESDCPFQVVKDTYADSLKLILEKLDFLSADQKAWLLYRTAERLLFS